MKVLILANSDIGLYQFRRELIGELLKSGDVILSLPYGEFVEPLEAMQCRFIDTAVERRGMNPATDFRLFLFYRNLLKTEKPDIVLTYTIKPNVYGGFACRLAHIPYAVNITGLGTAFEKNGLLKLMVSGMYRVACRKAKVVFFENEENRKVFLEEKIVREAQTHRLNGAGVNLEWFQMLEYPGDDTIRFLFMGRVMAEKGIEELFTAMRKLLADGVQCKLDIVGWYEENYKSKIEECEAEGWLHDHGFQKDVRPYIAECHCFVLPSWHEGMANTNLECAACGRPVITSNIPGCREAVEDGVSGLLAEQQNAEDLYRVMKQFCALPYEQRKAMGLAGRKRMEALFDRRKIVQETISCL